MGMVVLCSNSSARPIRRFKRNSWGRRLVAIRNWEAKYIRLNPATTAKSERVIFTERWLSTYSTTDDPLKAPFLQCADLPAHPLYPNRLDSSSNF
jgi:hypothetical protein